MSRDPNQSSSILRCPECGKVYADDFPPEDDPACPRCGWRFSQMREWYLSLERGDRAALFYELWGNYPSNHDIFDRYEEGPVIRHYSCERFGHTDFTAETMERLTDLLKAEYGQDVDVFGLPLGEVVACLRGERRALAGPIFDVTTLPHPLAATGELPSDLLAAFNGAIDLATMANSIRAACSWQDRIPYRLPQMTAAAAQLVANSVKVINDQWNNARAAILAVSNELTAVWDGPAQFGPITAPNAHLAALDYGGQLSWAVERAADPLGFEQRMVDPEAKTNPTAIVENFANVCAALRSMDLPDGEQVVAAVQWEAAKAAERRAISQPRSRDPKPAGPASPARHSPDFHSVHWFGTDYTFTPTQAACIAVLWKAWENDTPEISQAYILEQSGAESQKLADVLKGHPAWRVMIVKGSKRGAYRLAEEPPH